MKYEKEIGKAIKKHMKEHPDCELTIKGLICSINGEEEIITLESCPPAGCIICPDNQNPLCP